MATTFVYHLIVSWEEDIKNVVRIASAPDREAILEDIKKEAQDVANNFFKWHGSGSVDVGVSVVDISKIPQGGYLFTPGEPNINYCISHE